MATHVHPTAVVDPRAELAEGVEIGPYAVIGAQVTIGPDCWIGPHVVLDGRVTMGAGNRVYPGACIGLEPQDLKYCGAATEVVLGDGNTIRECVTVNRATQTGESTSLGNGNLLMAYSHIGHECTLGDGIVIANGVAVGGHVVIGDRAVIGGVLGIHQFVHVGRLAMVGGMSRIVRDVPPFCLVEGQPARVRAINKVGLKRFGLFEQKSGQVYADLDKTWRHVYRSGRPLMETLAELEQHPLGAAAAELVSFLRNSLQPSRRGPTPGGR